MNTTAGVVNIGGTNYKVVEQYSDSLATNSNEIMVFAYENDKTLTQLATLEALNDYVAELSETDLSEVIDHNWNPDVTRGVRLVSIIDDAAQHVGQAAYAAGILTR